MTVPDEVDDDDRMLMNRSAPHARIVPVLRVGNVRAAVELYTRVFGLVEHVQIGDGHRAQLGFPDAPAAELVIAEGSSGGHQVLLKVDDVAAIVARATAAGVTLLGAQEDFAYGERQAHLEDPFGQRWLLTQTLADTAPEDWGGKTVEPRP